MMKTLLAAATLAMLSASALAQTPSAKPDQHTTTAEAAFKKHDANGDGALTLPEVQVADAKVTEADFAKYDADRNSALSKDEFVKWVEAKYTPPASAPGQ